MEYEALGFSCGIRLIVAKSIFQQMHSLYVTRGP